MNIFLNQSISNRILIHCLETFNCILRLEKTFLSADLVSNPQFLPKATQLIIHSDMYVRLKACNLLGYITYFENLNIIRSLIQENILDYIAKSYYELDSKKSTPFIKSILTIISNLT